MASSRSASAAAADSPAFCASRRGQASFGEYVTMYSSIYFYTCCQKYMINYVYIYIYIYIFLYCRCRWGMYIYTVVFVDSQPLYFFKPLRTCCHVSLPTLVSNREPLCLPRRISTSISSSCLWASKMGRTRRYAATPSRIHLIKPILVVDTCNRVV